MRIKWFKRKQHGQDENNIESNRRESISTEQPVTKGNRTENTETERNRTEQKGSERIIREKNGSG